MNVHWRKTQKFEFKKKIKIVIVIITRHITMAKQHKRNYNRATILLPTKTTRNQSLFFTKQQTTTMAKYVQYHISPLDKRRHRKKRIKRRRKAQEGANTKLALKKNRLAPTHKIIMNKNEKKHVG